MSDKEKVIEKLTEIYDEAYDRWVHRPYIEDELVTLIRDCIPDALALLKEQKVPEATVDPCKSCQEWECDGCEFARMRNLMRLIDADALLYELTELVRHSTGEYKYGIEAARLVVMDTPTIGGWISAKERPKKDGDYLVRLKSGAMMVIGFTLDLRKINDYQFKHKKPGWYEYDQEWGFCERNDVTHYMPLPEPPKEE